MNTDTLDRDAYRAWWERIGRSDLGTCRCGAPSADLVLTAGTVARPRTLSVARSGFCPRHSLMPIGREDFAQAIVDVTFRERDRTEPELEQSVADGRPRYDA
jgi:hypothetical protein